MYHENARIILIIAVATLPMIEKLSLLIHMK